MAIIKEFKCREHGNFESGIAICPRCGKIAQRVFITPVGLSFGKARRIDAVIEGEFERRGISNYTNAGGTPKVNYGSGTYNGVTAGWGKQQLTSIQNQYQPAVPLSAPALPGGSNHPPEGTPTDRNSEPWSRHVPTERMDLTPNE